MMENKREGLVALVVRFLVGLLRRLGGSGAAPAPAPRPDGEVPDGNEGPVKPFEEPICLDPPRCTKYGLAPTPGSV